MDSAHRLCLPLDVWRTHLIYGRISGRKTAAHFFWKCSIMIDNTERNRFELIENGLTVFAEYRRHDDRYVLTHVEADPALRGTGAAARLMQGIIALAREKNLTLTPRCAYAVATLTYLAKRSSASARPDRRYPASLRPPHSGTWAASAACPRPPVCRSGSRRLDRAS